MNSSPKKGKKARELGGGWSASASEFESELSSSEIEDYIASEKQKKKKKPAAAKE